MHDWAFLGKIERNDRNVLQEDVMPDINFGPIRQWENSDGFARTNAGIEQIPKLGPLVARIPCVPLRAKRKDSFFRSTFFFVASSATKCRVETVKIKRLLQCFRFHDVRMERRTRGDRIDATLQAIAIDMN